MTDSSHPTPAPDAAPAAPSPGDAVATLVRWAAGVRYADLPDDVRRRALLVLADDLGAMIAVRDDPQVIAVRDSLVTAGQAPEATVFAAGRLRGERAAVAAANGAAADWAEMDEGYRPATCHAGLYVLPALLAEAEARDLSGEQLITALVAGYEVVTRIARAWRHEQLTIHPHALLGPIGAAAGAAFASGLDPDDCVAAVAGGASTAMMGPFDHALSGAMVRNVWTGIAAWTGIQMARWAPHGIGGDPSAPNTAFATAMGASTDLSQLTDDLGVSWGIRDGYHKLFACCQYAHSTVEPLLEIRAEDPTVADRVVTLEVRTHPLALKLDNARPTTSLAAKFSVPHVAAAALVRGVLDADACSPDAIVDPAIAALRERVTMLPFTPAPAPPHDRPATVVLTLDDGTTIERTCMSAIGSPDRPLSTETLLDDKIAGSVTPVHPEFVPTIRRLIEQPALLQRPWGELLNDLLKD
ncbi:MAG: MmgE/PrpD family protein [Patulibacter sp.]